jgi:transcriptional regulator with XRE-family HTH domain
VQTDPHGELLAMDFPERLVTLRKARGLTQTALAELAGVHLTQVQRYENGSSQPTMEVIRKLAIGLTVSADLLLFDQEERGPDEHLKLQFEAIKQFDPEDRQIVEGMLEGMILKHQAKRLLGARQAAAPTAPAPTEKSTSAARAKRSTTPKRRASR